jgi:hypothetical protein
MKKEVGSGQDTVVRATGTEIRGSASAPKCHGSPTLFLGLVGLHRVEKCFKIANENMGKKAKKEISS